MQPNAQGWCDSYYGTWNIKNKPKLGVHYLMIDEHVKKIIDNQKEVFHKELSDLMKSFTKTLKSTVEKNAEEIENLHRIMGDMTNFMYNIIDLNKLIEPKIDKSNKVNKKRVKPKIEEEDNNDGYL